MRRGQGFAYDLAQALGRPAFAALRDHVIAKALDDLEIGTLLIRREVDLLGLVPYRGRDRAGRHDDHVDPEEHQFPPQTLRQTFESVLGGSVETHEGGGETGADRRDVNDASRRAGERAV